MAEVSKKSVRCAKCRRWCRWIISEVVVALVVGVVSSILATWICFRQFRQDFDAVIGKSLDIIRFSDAIAEIDKVSDYTFGNIKEPASAPSAFGRLERERTQIGEVYAALRTISTKFDSALTAYEKLPVSEEPAKLYDELTPAPKQRFKKDLEELALRVHDLRSLIKSVEDSAIALPASIEQDNIDRYQATKEHVESLIVQIRRARDSMVARLEALRETISQFRDD